MRYKNSFFRIEIKDDGTYLNLYPVVRDGKALDMNEVLDFLERKNCVDYSVRAVKEAFTMLSNNPVQVKINDAQMEPFDESAVITVAPDNMSAYIRFYPASTNGKLMSKQEILAELESQKIKYGIVEQVIDVYLTARQYCLNIPIAKGTRPVQATDTVIEYKFDTKPLAKPKALEDGSVDFRELNLFTEVHKGDVLAVLTPHSEGEPGKDIYGNVVVQNRPKIQFLKYGRNITLSEDRCVITSDVDGNVTFADGTVFVSDVYNVAADVDNSTGNIDYDGSVVIAGTVKTGFTVKAKGDIQVNGVVEGATLVAGGNIVIKRGVQGGGKGRLQAGGDVCAKFFESANVNAKGDITAGSILHSRIVSGGKITVSGKRGFIVGGEIVCANSVEVHTIGNRMETQTVIKVGTNIDMQEELKTLAGEIKELQVAGEEISSYLNVYKEKVKGGAQLSPESMKQVKAFNIRLAEILTERDQKKARMENLKLKLDLSRKGFVKVWGNTYRGVSLHISNYIYTVKEKDTRCLYKIIDGEIGPSSFL